MPQHHPTPPRGLELAPQSVLYEGRFGRMFRKLPSFIPSEGALRALAATMLEPEEGGEGNGEGTELDNPTIPAGYTYFGQFIDHDITFDPVSSLRRLNDPDALTDFRTPAFDLDCVYGTGPNNAPYMYEQAESGGAKLLIGRTLDGEDDLPRNTLHTGDPDKDRMARALIGDPRNDENIIISQLQLTFLKFHNKVVNRIAAGQAGLKPDELFTRAQRIVRWHYQWVVVHDFLVRIAGQEVVNDILTSEPYVVNGPASPVSLPVIKLRFYSWEQHPYMPVEFSVAAYRFGHSMIRDDYKINQIVPKLPIFSPEENAGELDDFRGFRRLPNQWTLDWSFFFETGSPAHLQHARLIDSKLSRPLGRVPGTGDPHALAVRNLFRGRALKLPSGQRVARAMGIAPLNDAELGIEGVSAEFKQHAPLWFYLLKEAEVIKSGHQLGPVGGRIVAEVLLGLLKGDPGSYINIEPRWTPGLAPVPGHFSMPDLIKFALT